MIRQHKPIPKRRKTPRRKRPELFPGHEAERLHGKAREARRAEIFARAQGKCEEVKMLSDLVGINVRYYRCNNPATEWSHKKHGPRKCDCMDCGIASCHDCHVRRHNSGGKPCPSKGKVCA